MRIIRQLGTKSVSFVASVVVGASSVDVAKKKMPLLDTSFSFSAVVLKFTAVMVAVVVARCTHTRPHVDNGGQDLAGSRPVLGAMHPFGVGSAFALTVQNDVPGIANWILGHTRGVFKTDEDDPSNFPCREDPIHMITKHHTNHTHRKVEGHGKKGASKRSTLVFHSILVVRLMQINVNNMIGVPSTGARMGALLGEKAR